MRLKCNALWRFGTAPQRALLDALARATADAVFWTDADGWIKWCNVAAERMFGYSGSELKQMSIQTLLPLLSHPDASCRNGLLRRAQAAARWELNVTYRGGREFPAVVSITGSFEDSCYAVIVRDNTLQQLKEQELTALRRSIAQDEACAGNAQCNA